MKAFQFTVMKYTQITNHKTDNTVTDVNKDKPFLITINSIEKKRENFMSHKLQDRRTGYVSVN